MIKLILLLALIAPVHSRASQELTIFGLAVGAPIQLPECPKYEFLGRIEYRSVVVDPTCISVWPATKSAIDLTHGTIFISFPIREQPSIASGEINGYVEQGKLVGLRIFTRGIKLQHYDLEQLIEKFGPPTSKSTISARNRLGATFDVLTATWKLADLSVAFFASDGSSLDRGIIEILTPAARIIVKEREEKLSKLLGKKL